MNIFNKHGNSSTLKYRRELTPNIRFQLDRIFIRNDSFEQIIKIVTIIVPIILTIIVTIMKMVMKM